MRQFDPQWHHRRSIRLRGYDYAQPGAYYLTICTKEHALLFGEVRGEQMWLNEAGTMADVCWHAIPEHFPHVELDAYVIMPNHVHGIIWIMYHPHAGNEGSLPPTTIANVGAENLPPLRPPHVTDHRTPFRSPSRTVGSIVRGFKIGVTTWMRDNTDVYEVWQRDFYDRIVRDDEELDRIREYIMNNPARWDQDSIHPSRM